MGCAMANIYLATPPGALWRDQKVKYHLILITKSISKIFKPNFVCVLTNERYKTYQTGFSICHQGVPRGAKKIFFFFKHGHVAYLIDG